MNDTAATAYVRDGRLCIVGVQDSEMGPVPFTYTTDVGSDVPNGPVDLNATNQHAKVSTAIENARKPMLSKVEDEKMRITAEEWVERARAGDQNAIALISGARENALRGVARAKKAVKLIADYIRSHPVDLRNGDAKRYLPQQTMPNRRVIQKLVQFCGDDAAVGAWTPEISKSDPYLAALILADGPNLTKERVTSIGAHFGEDQSDYWDGFKRWQDKPFFRGDVSDALIAGQAVAHARALQGFRQGALPLSALCEVAGWEMGE